MPGPVFRRLAPSRKPARRMQATVGQQSRGHEAWPVKKPPVALQARGILKIYPVGMGQHQTTRGPMAMDNLCGRPFATK